MNKVIRPARMPDVVPNTAAIDAADAASKDKVEPIIEQLLSKAFRRPATDADVKRYGSIVIGHMNSGHSLEEGLHLAIRTSLISPQFLYRGHRPGKLDDWDLATRLSYFLTGGPPDDQLAAIASAGTLSDSDQLVAEANRLIDSERVHHFVKTRTKNVVVSSCVRNRCDGWVFVDQQMHAPKAYISTVTVKTLSAFAGRTRFEVVVLRVQHVVFNHAQQILI